MLPERRQHRDGPAFPHSVRGFLAAVVRLESQSPTPKRDSWGCYPIHARHSAVAVANSRMIQTDKETLISLSVSFVPHK
jgi:hypothetical protein